MAFTNLKEENQRLTATNRILSRALGTAISLLETIIACRDWDDFITVRDQIQPTVSEMSAQLLQTAEQLR